jgi:hypothetical protein
MSDEPRDPALDPLVRELPSSIEPPRDLWPGIERRLTPRRRGLPRWLPLAAALALLLLGGAVLRRLARDPGPGAAPVATVDPSTTADPSATAERALLASLEHDAGSLSPATIATLRRNLAIIDTALAESHRALAADPGNGDMQALLRLVQRQRATLLQQAARLPRT